MNIKRIQSFDHIVLDYIEKNDNFSFIQIGSNDGELNHGFFELVISSASFSILVEPVPIFFNDLKLKFSKNKNVFLKIVLLVRHQKI